MEYKKLLKESCEEMGVSLDEKQIEQFMQYLSLLLEWNEKMNLTAITEFDEVIDKHFVDSLALIQAVDLHQPLKLIDVGTGAGFPGIPLKIAFPHLKIVLLDSLNKRIQFLNTVIEELGLSNIETIHGRAEDFAKKDLLRESFDICVSRAVANLASLSEYCLPYVNLGGYFIPYKSGKVDEELEESKKAVFLLGGKIEEEVKFNLPDSDITRSLIKIKKVSATPKKYPRKSGLATKEPIK